MYFTRYQNGKNNIECNSTPVVSLEKKITSLNQTKQQTYIGFNPVYISDLRSVDNISERLLRVDKTIFLSLDYKKVRLFQNI